MIEYLRKSTGSSRPPPCDRVSFHLHGVGTSSKQVRKYYTSTSEILTISLIAFLPLPSPTPTCNGEFTESDVRLMPGHLPHQARDAAVRLGPAPLAVRRANKMVPEKSPMPSPSRKPLQIYIDIINRLHDKGNSDVSETK